MLGLKPVIGYHLFMTNQSDRCDQCFPSHEDVARVFLEL